MMESQHSQCTFQKVYLSVHSKWRFYSFLTILRHKEIILPSRIHAGNCFLLLASSVGKEGSTATGGKGAETLTGTLTLLYLLLWGLICFVAVTVSLAGAVQ